MPKRTDIASVLIIGAGPIVIGQACRAPRDNDKLVIWDHCYTETSRHPGTAIICSGGLLS